MMDTYVTLEGRVLDLAGLSDEQRTYFTRCVAAYREGIGWERFRDLSLTNQNPLIRDAGGQITSAVRAHPLHRAIRDLEVRLGIQQGYVGPEPGDDSAPDPFAGDRIPAPEAARG